MILGVLDRQADLGEPGRPLEHQAVDVVVALGAGGEPVVDLQRQAPDSFGLRGVDVIAPHELRHRRLAHVAVLHAAEQVIQHAVTQRALRHLHRLDAELVERRAHDGEPARQHRRAVRPQPGDALGIGLLVLDEQRAQAL